MYAGVCESLRMPVCSLRMFVCSLRMLVLCMCVYVWSVWGCFTSCWFVGGAAEASAVELGILGSA